MHDDLIVMTTQAESGVVVGEWELSTISGVSRWIPRCGSLGFVGAVEAGPLELDRHRGINLADLLLAAFRAYGDRIVGERLLLGEVVVAVLATVMVSRHDILALRTIPNFLTGHILVRSLRRPSNRPILGHRHNHPA